MTLATKGAAAIDKGTIVAVVPMVFPTINLDKGKTKIINIMKGIDLSILTALLNILFIKGFSQIFPSSVIINSIPNGNPIIREKNR